MSCVKASTDAATCCFVLALICGVYVADCEMISLIEDDTGMELLVCNKIISLDLPVKEVYKKIWCTQPDVSSGVMGGGGVQEDMVYPA